MKYTGIILAGGGHGNGASLKFVINNKARSKEIETTIGIMPFAGTLNVKLNKKFGYFKHPHIKGQLLRIKGFIGGHTYKFNPGMKNPANYKFPIDYTPQSCSFYKAKLNSIIDVWLMRFDIDMYDKHFVEIICKDHLRQKYNLKTGGAITIEIDGE